MKRYRQKLLHHVLLVSQQLDGTWSFVILGARRVRQQNGYRSAAEAKQAAHALAHRHLENKRACDFVELFAWSEEKS